MSVSRIGFALFCVIFVLYIMEVIIYTHRILNVRTQPSSLYSVHFIESICLCLLVFLQSLVASYRERLVHHFIGIISLAPSFYRRNFSRKPGKTSGPSFTTTSALLCKAMSISNVISSITPRPTCCSEMCPHACKDNAATKKTREPAPEPAST